MTLHSYWTSKCAECPLKTRCTTGKERRIKRWEHEAVIDAMQDRLDRAPKSMRVRRATVEQPFGTLKAWMGATHFKTRTLEMVRTEMSLHVLAYNLKRVIAILGAQPLMEPCGPEAAPQKRMLLSVEIRQPETASWPTIRRSRICFFTSGHWLAPPRWRRCATSGCSRSGPHLTSAHCRHSSAMLQIASVT